MHGASSSLPERHVDLNFSKISVLKKWVTSLRMSFFKLNLDYFGNRTAERNPRDGSPSSTGGSLETTRSSNWSESDLVRQNEELKAKLEALAAENMRLKRSVTQAPDDRTERSQLSSSSSFLDTSFASLSLSSSKKRPTKAPPQDNMRWARLSDLGVLQEEDIYDSSPGGDETDSDSVQDALEAMNKLLIMDSPLDSPSGQAHSDLPVSESADSSFSVSLSSNTTEDLTGFILRDSEYPAHGGGYADVYKGVLKKDEKEIKVAVKVIRAHTYTAANQWKIEKRLRREIRLWSCLRHPNVVPLLGTTMSFGSYTAMVCPWMNDGNLHHYLNDKKPELNLRRRLQILADLVEGLSYLHSQPVVHGDLTTGNVLMDGGKAHLSDFGLSNVMADVRNNSFISSTVGGAPRWTAPELLHFGADVNAVPDIMKSSDIYSFGSVALQVISGRIPFEDMVSDIHVLMALMKGSMPPRPAEPLLSDAFWDFIISCWSKDPSTRPEIEKVREKLQLLRYCCSEDALAANVVDANNVSDKESTEDE